MDSIKFFKGYDKVNHLENQNPHPKLSPKLTPKRSSTAITISAIILFTLVIALTIAAFIFEPIKYKNSSNSVDSIKNIVCNVTRYPDSCFTSLSSLNSSTKPDPQAFLDLSLHAAITHLKNLTYSFKSLYDTHPQPVLKDCLTLFDDALSRLNDSVSLLKKVALTKEKISAIQAWISAALTDQDTCDDGLEEMGWKAPDDQVKEQAQIVKELISNSLAIVANMQILVHKFGLKLL